MSQSSAVEIRLEVQDGEVLAVFQDAGHWEWRVGFGALSDFDNDELVRTIAEHLDAEAADLAESLVRDLRKSLENEAS